MRNTKTFAICGVAGHNRGDDAIAMAVADGIHAKLPGATVSIAMLKLGPIPARPGIEPFLSLRRRPAGLLQLAFNIARSDVVVLGGGSLIQDKFGGDRIRGVLGYAWLVSFLARMFRKPLVTAPLGVDTLHHERSKRVAAEVLARCDAIFVRDARSLENALALNMGRSATPRRVCDPAFAIAGTMNQEPSDDAPIVFAPAFESEFDELVAEIFARLAERVLAATQRRIVLVAMDDRAEEDAGKLGLILDRLDPTTRRRVSAAVPADLGSALDLLRGSAGVVAMRLHAMILGYGFVPVVCLSRTTKTDAFMEDYRVPGLKIDARSDPVATANALAAEIRVWAQRDAQRGIRSECLTELDSFFERVIDLAKVTA